MLVYKVGLRYQLEVDTITWAVTNHHSNKMIFSDYTVLN